MDQIKTHPFDHLLLALPSSVEVSDEISIHVPWQVFHRREGDDSLYDYCAVLLYFQTEWFVLTEAHTRMTNKMTLMVTKEDGKPLASFADPDIAKCFGDKFCFEELSMSWEFHPNNNGSRLPFRQFNHTSDDVDDIVSLMARRFLQDNNSTCDDLVTEVECEATDGCGMILSELAVKKLIRPAPIAAEFSKCSVSLERHSEISPGGFSTFSHSESFLDNWIGSQPTRSASS